MFSTLFWAFALLVVGTFIVLMAALEGGRIIGARRAKTDPETAAEGLGPLEGAVYGLMGLLIAFTFSGAAERFDARRDLITAETNAIGGAYLKIDLLPPAVQVKLRKDYRDYVDARLAAYKDTLNDDYTDHANKRVVELQELIWKQSVAGSMAVPSPAVATLVLSSVTDMIDVTTKRAVALVMHPPIIVYVLLGVVMLGSALLAGYGMGAKRTKSLLHTIGFALITTTSIFVIVNMEYPRVGIVRIDASDKFLIELRDSMK